MSELDVCHCGKPVYVYEGGFTRHMCEMCSDARCDLPDSLCPEKSKGHSAVKFCVICGETIEGVPSKLFIRTNDVDTFIPVNLPVCPFRPNVYTLEQVAASPYLGMSTGTFFDMVNVLQSKRH